MTVPGGEEALRRLKSILDGSTIVESDLFPRLVQALVRLSGGEGEAFFAERVVAEKSPLMSALLTRASVSVLGNRAIGFLVKGSLTGVNLERVRATTDVLSQLATVEAHSALTELSQKLRHPVAREMAASKLQELEQARPTRYQLLPRLNRIDSEDAEALLAKFLEVNDRELVPLLLEAFPGLPFGARVVVCRLFERHGDQKAAQMLQDRLSLGVEEELFDPLFRCLRELLKRYPAVAEAHIERWAETWKRFNDRAEAAHATAIALTLRPDAKFVRIYGEFLSSPFEPVRTAGLEALAVVPEASLAAPIKACLNKGSLRERIAAFRALAPLGEVESPFMRAAGSEDPALRQAAASVALELDKRDIWSRMTIDADEQVIKAAFESVGRSPAEKRPSPRELEKILLQAIHPKTFEGACLTLGTTGDKDSAKSLAGALVRSEPWVREPAIRALKALRSRGILRWADLDAPARKRVIDAVAETPDALSMALVGTFLEDLPLSDLSDLRKRMFSGALPPHGPAQAILMAMIGRIHVMETRGKALATLEDAFSMPLLTPQQQAEAIRKIASLWIRVDIDLGAEVSEKIEKKLTEAAENKGFSPSARSIAIGLLGRGATLPAFSTLMRLRSHPTEQIAAAAAEALEVFARRHPSVNLAESTASGDTSHRTVLVVEDDTNTRTIYQNFLVKMGFRALGASDGMEGLKVIRSSHVDAVLLDLQMEGMDGFGFLEALATHMRRPPVIVITGLSDRNTVIRVLKLGANDYLRKPVDLSDMFSRLERCLHP